MPDSKRSPEAKERRRIRARTKDKLRRKSSLAAGLCTHYGCNQPHVADKKLCQFHLDLYREKIRTIGRRFKFISKLAAQQGKSWELSEEEWKAIIAMPCRYCKLPNDVKVGAGMDRLDNSKGYVRGNVVSCCYKSSPRKPPTSVGG